MSRRIRALTPSEVIALPAMPDLVPDGAGAVGVSRDLAYDLAKKGEFPVPVIKMGRCLKVRRQDLLSFLGITEELGDGARTAIPAPPVENAPISTSPNQ